MQLYVNGGLRLSGSMANITDWSGGGDTRLADLGDLGGGQGSGYGAFSGQIAIFRYYDGVLTHREVGDNYFEVSNIVPEPSTFAMLLGLTGRRPAGLDEAAVELSRPPKIAYPRSPVGLVLAGPSCFSKAPLLRVLEGPCFLGGALLSAIDLSNA